MMQTEMQGAAKQLSQLAEYSALKREAQSSTELYNNLYSRVKEAGIAAASKSSNVRVVDQARVLDVPTRPKVLVNLALGFLVAMIGAILLPFLRERIHNYVNDAEDVRRWTGISSVAVVPLAANGNGQAPWRNLLMNGNRNGARGSPAKFLLQNPDSAQAEALRGLETAVMLSGPTRPPQVLLVASSVPAEGKTTVAINLATALAQQGRTCIVDADLRRSMVGSAFNLHESVGLGQHLAETAAFNSILFAVPEVANLTIVPAGQPVHDPGKLIRCGRMAELLQSLRQHYDFIVIDSPPVLLYADGRVLSTLVDGIVFVARAGEVTRDAFVRSIEYLNQVHSAPILQIVINGSDEITHTYGYGYRYERAHQGPHAA
jgi:capsular exopolysaccharide synthesis family protein